MHPFKNAVVLTIKSKNINYKQKALNIRYLGVLPWHGKVITCIAVVMIVILSLRSSFHVVLASLSNTNIIYNI